MRQRKKTCGQCYMYTCTEKAIRQDGRTKEDGALHQYCWGNNVDRRQRKEEVHLRTLNCLQKLVIKYNVFNLITHTSC